MASSKKINFRHLSIITGLGVLGVLTNCGGDQRVGRGSKLYSDSTEYPALLGNGYDSLKLEHKQRACVEGKNVTKAQIESSAEFNKIENWTTLLGQMNFSVPGSIYLNSGSDLAKFVVRARDTYLSSTYIMTNKVSVRKDILNDSNIIFDDANKEKFGSSCGNQYISVVESGGIFHVGVKFSFSDMQYKESFDAGGALQSITGLGTKIDSLSEDIKKHSSVEIFMHQVGGELQALHSIFDSNDIMACSLDHFDQCEHLLKDIWSYATDRFVKDVQNGKEQTIGFKTVDYPNHEKPFEDMDIKRERRKILDALEQHLSDYDVLNVIRGNLNEYLGDDEKKCDSRCLQRLSNTISSNIRALKESVVLSFYSPEDFRKYGVLSGLDLHPYTVPHKKLETPNWIASYSKYLIGGTAATVIHKNTTLFIPGILPPQP